MTELILLEPLSRMIISDWKLRRIYTDHLVFFVATVLAIVLFRDGWVRMWINIQANSLVLSVWITGMWLLSPFYYKGGGFWGRYMGIGDLVFVVALLPIIPPTVLALLLQASYMLGMIGWGIYKCFRPQTKTVPLVSVTGTGVALYIIFNVVRYG